MSDVEERLRTLVQVADPAGTVTVRWLADLIGERIGPEEPTEEPLADLTVEEVANAMHRAPSTVRGWLSRKELDGYKINGRDWRVTRAALRRFQEEQAREDHRLPPGEVDISEWRQTA